MIIMFCFNNNENVVDKLKIYFFVFDDKLDEKKNE